MSQKIVVVGGVAGGASFVARMRRLNEQADIVLFEKGPYVSFANCGLPYHIGGVIENRDALFVQTAEGIATRFNVRIHENTEVVAIDRAKKEVQVTDHKNGKTWTESYDKLVLSPGAAPMRPPIEGLDNADNVFTLRNIPDTDQIIAYMTDHSVKHATVIGGGFIGLEMAENLHHAGLEVSLVEMSDQVMAPIDPELAAEVHIEMRLKGVELILGDGMAAFQNGGKKLVLQSGKEINTDMTILAIGVRPENKLAQDAGLDIGERGGIIVNQNFQTNDPDIYAIGDAIQVTDFVQNTPTQIPLAGPANRQGRLVADHIAGRDILYRGTLGTSVAKVFDLTVAATGSNEKTLKRLGQSYQAIHISPASHAGYYPGASPISLKALYDPADGRIYGAQAVGRENVDKAIDTIATAIFAGLSIYDLADLELSYAPPYGSAKAPVNFVGYVAQNIRDGLRTAEWDEVAEIVNRDDAMILDVTTPEEHAAGHLPGAVNISLDSLRDRLHELPKDKHIYIHCAVGLRGYIGARILEQHDYNVTNIDGGYRTWVHYQIQDKVEPMPSLPNAADEPAPNEENSTCSHTVIDCCGLQCPGPLVQVNRTMSELAAGDRLTVSVSDPGFQRDVQAFCQSGGHRLISGEQDGSVMRFVIEKGAGAKDDGEAMAATKEKPLSMVVFSGDYDKVMAAFVIANGARAMGRPVSMFFTFWGLNALRKSSDVKKEGFELLFDKMMPEGAGQLGLSKMNMGGMGTKMMKQIMKNKNVSSLEELIYDARKSGVELIACSMSMDVMGIKEEELIDGVAIGGVGTYLGKAGDAATNLFI